MNSTSELYKRMLESFPVSLLKFHFQCDGTKNDVIEYIVKTIPLNKIDEFVCSGFGHLHQRIFIREVKNRSLLKQPVIMSDQLLDRDTQNSGVTWFYLHKAFFHYYDTKSDTKEVLEFLVPVKIRHKGIKLIVSINTFARDIKTYFDYPVFPLPSYKIEDVVFNDIRSNCSQVILKLDLNKGIKYLWENDVIDGLDVKHRQSKSIRSDRMDENYTYKISYPNDWKDLMQTPIQKTKFKLIKNSGLRYFECNPSTGFIGLTIHPDNDTELNDLLDLILKHN